jgi:nitrogen regulatory protein P-II 1
MKKIEAVVPHARLDLALAALRELGLGGLTYYESKGRGQNPIPRVQSGRGTSTYVPEFNVNSTIVLVVREAQLQNVVDAIVESTSTGLAGEGKIFVSDVEDAVDIGSRKRGEDQV